MKRIESGLLLLAIIVFSVVASASSTYAQSPDNSNQARQNSQDKPLKIKKKPHASPRGCDDIGSGRVILKITFDKSAKVTKVVPVRRSGCQRFDESAVDAAKKIRFEPAIKNGEPVTVVKTVEYSFSIY